MHSGEIFLVVDQDAHTRDEICKMLARAGYRAEGGQGGAESRSAASLSTYACILVGVDPPELAGLEVLARARERSMAVLVALSAEPAVAVRIEVFRSGAELIIPKPVDEGELLAALDAILSRRRRCERSCHPSGTCAECRTAFDDTWVLDCSTWRLRSPQGVCVGLTSHEFVLLRALMLAKGDVVPRTMLQELLYRRCDASANRALDAVVLRLRRKIGLQCGIELPFRTKHGNGYVLTSGVLTPPEAALVESFEIQGVM